MPALLVILFVLVPLVEIYLVLQVGAAIGAWWTIGLLVADSVIGAWLLKVEGRRAWSQFRAALQAGRWPGDEVAQGALVIVGGTLLLTPGFLTDGVGLVLLIAPTRRALSRFLRSRYTVGMAGGIAGARAARGRRDGGADSVYDVEVVEIEREQGPLPGETDGTHSSPDTTDDPDRRGGPDRTGGPDGS